MLEESWRFLTRLFRVRSEEIVCLLPREGDDREAAGSNIVKPRKYS